MKKKRLNRKKIEEILYYASNAVLFSTISAMERNDEIALKSFKAMHDNIHKYIEGMGFDGYDSGELDKIIEIYKFNKKK